MALTQPFSMMPRSPPPLGREPSYMTPADRSNIYTAVGSIGIAFAVLFVSLRLYAKIRILKSAGWDDVACILALIGRAAITALILNVSSYGVGKHRWDVPLRNFNHINNYTFILTKLEPPTYFFTKLSLLLLYFRLFSSNEIFKYLILAGIIFCFVAYTTAVLLYIFLKKEFILKINTAIGAFNVISDIYVLCLPLMAVSRLQLPRRKKLGVIVVFLSGIFACIMSILALIYRARFRDGFGSDLTWDIIPAYTVSSVEGDVGIMCACMPFFPALCKGLPSAQHFASSIKYWRPWTSRNENTNNNSAPTWPSPQQPLKVFGSEGHYAELGEADLAGKASPMNGPKTFRMEVESFQR